MNEGQLFRLALAWSGLNAAEIGRRTGINRSTLSGWMADQRAPGVRAREEAWTVVGYAFEKSGADWHRLRLRPGTWRRCSPDMEDADLEKWLEALRMSGIRLSWTSIRTENRFPQAGLLSLHHLPDEHDHQGVEEKAHHLVVGDMTMKIQDLSEDTDPPVRISEWDYQEWVNGCYPPQKLVMELGFATTESAVATEKQQDAAETVNWSKVIPAIMSCARFGATAEEIEAQLDCLRTVRKC